MVNIRQWLRLASRQPDEHKYFLTDEGVKLTESLDYFRKYECDFYILLHLRRFKKAGQDKEEIQKGLEPFYTGKEAGESIKQLLKTRLIQIKEIGGNNQ